MSDLPSSEQASHSLEGGPVEWPAVRIRPMAGPDLPAVSAIDRASFTLPWPANSYRFELYENPSSLLYVAEAGDERIVGMIVVWVIIDEAHIATIAVEPAWRGRGIAQELMAAALVEAIRKGAVSATLEVRQHNFHAQRLYRRFRFDEVGRRPRYYHDNHEDALIMTASGLDERYLAWLETGGWRSLPTPRPGENG